MKLFSQIVYALSPSLTALRLSDLPPEERPSLQAHWRRLQCLPELTATLLEPFDHLADVHMACRAAAGNNVVHDVISILQVNTG